MPTLIIFIVLCSIIAICTIKLILECAFARRIRNYRYYMKQGHYKRGTAWRIAGMEL